MGANRVVVAAILVAAVVSPRPGRSAGPPFSRQLRQRFSIALGFLGFVAVVYVTRRQVVLFPRYGLVLFVLGLPLFVWVGQLIAQRLKPGWLGKQGGGCLVALLPLGNETGALHFSEGHG